MPDGGAIRNVDGLRQAAEPLVAHAIEQLIFHLLIRQVVEPLEYQDAHHRLGRIRRAAALSTLNSRRDMIDLDSQRGKVDVLLNLGQRIANPFELLAVMFAGKEVVLDRATLLHGSELPSAGGRSMLSRHYRYCDGRFFEVPCIHASILFISYKLPPG